MQQNPFGCHAGAAFDGSVLRLPAGPPRAIIHAQGDCLSKILVVDDHADASELMALLFETLGHDTRVAADGREAVRLHAAFAPDIVFMDLDMPVLNGYEAARAIRADAVREQPFLVALTASKGAAVEVATHAVGFDFYLHKPADTNALLALVEQLARGKRQAP